MMRLRITRHRGVSAMLANSGRQASILLLSIGLLLTACDGSAPGPSAPSAQPAVSASDDPTEIARRVVADFLSLPLSEVTPVVTESKEFTDASLGCPVAGMSYAQVITPGYRVVVEADGRRFDVRVSGTSGRICRKPADGARPTSGTSPKRPGTPGSAVR